MTRESIGESLALVNAILNGTTALLIVAGRIAIARKKVLTHRGLMIGAFITSSVFLTSYLTRVALTGTHADPHRGVVHVVYYVILITHMILAMATVPLVLRTLWLAYKKRFEQQWAAAHPAYSASPFVLDNNAIRTSPAAQSRKLN